MISKWAPVVSDGNQLFFIHSKNSRSNFFAKFQTICDFWSKISNFWWFFNVISHDFGYLVGFRRRPKYNCTLLFHFRIRSSFEIILIFLTEQSKFWNFSWFLVLKWIEHGILEISCTTWCEIFLAVGGLPRFNAVKRGTFEY